MIFFISSANIFWTKPLKNYRNNLPTQMRVRARELSYHSFPTRVWKFKERGMTKLSCCQLVPAAPSPSPSPSLPATPSQQCNSKRLREGVEIVEWRGRVRTDVSGQQSCGLDTSHAVELARDEADGWSERWGDRWEVQPNVNKTRKVCK